MTVYVTHQRVVDSQGEVHERINVLWLHNHVPAEVSQQCQKRKTTYNLVQKASWEDLNIKYANWFLILRK